MIYIKMLFYINHYQIYIIKYTTHITSYHQLVSSDSVLQCVAVCCSALQCVAVCYRLQCVAVCCSVLQCVAVRVAQCITLD